MTNFSDIPVETMFVHDILYDSIDEIPKANEIIGKTYYVAGKSSVIQYNGSKWIEQIKNKNGLIYIFVESSQHNYPNFIICGCETYNNTSCYRYAACDRCHCVMLKNDLVTGAQDSPKGLLYCIHCFFSMNHNKIENCSHGVHGLDIVDYILKYERCHNQKTCKYRDTCFICDFKNGTLNSDIRNIHKLYDHLIKNANDGKKINITI